jgi:5-enolpyruvylshikimate-3-phosphate synthase
MIEEKLLGEGYIPLDKSWMNRVGVLDLLNGYDDTINFLKKQKVLGEDLQSLYQASLEWKAGKKYIHVGQSGTLLRFLRTASWKLGLEKEFILEGTLKNRKVCDDPSKVIGQPLEKVLKLDGGTSQWVSAVGLLYDLRMKTDEPKINLTYEAVDHWNDRRSRKECWDPRYDVTLLKQAVGYLKILNGGERDFKEEHSEDYCFAVAFGFMTKYQGEKRWPKLKNHESNRLESMQTALMTYYGQNSQKTIYSDDHRVVQAMAMLIKSQNRRMSIKEIRSRFSNPDCVDKSWPQFWKFLEDSIKIR